MTIAELKKFRPSITTATVYHEAEKGFSVSFESSFTMFNYSQLETARDRIRYFKTLDAAYNILKELEFNTFTVNTIDV